MAAETTACTPDTNLVERVWRHLTDELNNYPLADRSTALKEDVPALTDRVVPRPV